MQRLPVPEVDTGHRFSSAFALQRAAAPRSLHSWARASEHALPLLARGAVLAVVVPHGALVLVPSQPRRPGVAVNAAVPVARTPACRLASSEAA